MGDKKYIQEVDLFRNVAGHFTEAMLIPFDRGNEAQSNVFGRSVQVNTKGGLSHLLGTASTGMRSAGFIPVEDIEAELGVLSSFNRLHIPLTLVIPGNGSQYISQLIDAGCIVFKARNNQAFSDLILVGQVISEKTLAPFVLLVDNQHDNTQYECPDDKDLIQWFGNPDERVKDPTLAQEMVLGPSRRRMPSWLHVDQPVLTGAKKDAYMAGLEKAAASVYEQSHYQQVINETFAVFAELTKREYNPYSITGPANAKNLLFAMDVARDVTGDKDLLKKLDKTKTCLLIPYQYYPLATDEFMPKHDVERLQVLEPVSGNSRQGDFFAWISTSRIFSKAFKENGWYIHAPSAKAIVAAMDHLLDTKSSSDRFWLDVPLNREASKFPKHEVLIQQIRRNYPDIEQLSVESDVVEDAGPIQVGSVPSVIRRYANQGPPFARINRFYNDTFCLYEQAREEMVADPFQAYPVMPAMSAAFRHLEGQRAELPVFDPAKCDEIDGLILSCPYGALTTGLITIEKLIETGIKLANERGNQVAQVMPHKKKWIRSSTELAIEREKIRFAADFLKEGFDQMLAAAKLDEEKEEILRSECSHILDAIGNLKVVVDRHLFKEREQRSTGEGELFIVAVDPHTCTGCGYCTLPGSSACMQMKPQREQLQEVTDAYDLFDQLPVTTSHSIERLVEDEEFDPFAALMLNKDYYQSFATSSKAELNQNETVIRYFLGLNAHLIKPQRVKEIEKLDELINRLSEGIRNILGNSIPMNQMNSLMEVIASHQESRLNMHEIFGEWGRVDAFSPVEKGRLQKKLQLLGDLKMLKNLLESGMTGKGRPACTMILDKSLGDLAEYPYNQFSVPVLFAEKENTAALALGACEGQARHSIDQVRLLRRAELEASDRYIPSRHDDELARLTWDDLTEEERKSVPPVLIFANNHLLSGSTNDQLMTLLQSHYPVKICLIDTGYRDPGNLLSELQNSSNQLWPFISQGEAFMGRGTLSDRNYLYRLMKRSLVFDGTSMITVLAPDASEFEIHPSNWMQLSALAVSARAFIQMAYDPVSSSDSIASHILPHVENVDDDFHTVQLKYEKDGVEATMDYAMSWADWAFLQKDLSGHFRKLSSSDEVVMIKDYIAGSGNSSKTPAIMRINAEGQSVFYAVDEQIVDACRIVVRNTRVLREWAGLFTAYPEKLRALLKEELRTEYDADKAAFEREVNRQKSEWEATYLQELKNQIKDKLLNMSGM